MFENRKVRRCSRLTFAVKSTEGHWPADNQRRRTSSNGSITFRAVGRRLAQPSGSVRIERGRHESMADQVLQMSTA
jgi:hypothetical protein